MSRVESRYLSKQNVVADGGASDARQALRIEDRCGVDLLLAAEEGERERERKSKSIIRIHIHTQREKEKERNRDSKSIIHIHIHI